MIIKKDKVYVGEIISTHDHEIVTEGWISIRDKEIAQFNGQFIDIEIIIKPNIIKTEEVKNNGTANRSAKSNRRRKTSGSNSRHQI